MVKLLAFYDEDGIGPETSVVFTFEQAVNFHPYLAVRGATAAQLEEWTEMGELMATKMGDEYCVSLPDLEAFVDSGCFKRYSVEIREFRCDPKLYLMLDLISLGYVRQM